MLTYRLTKLLLATAMLSSVAIASEVTVASAADAPPRFYGAPPPPYFLWSGFYAGAHLGVGWGDNDAGFIGGGQVGYNYQINHWVLGLEGDVSGTSIKDSTNVNFGGFGSINATASLDWIATLTPRVGYAFDRWLVYGKAGGAWAHASGSVSGFGMSVSADSTVSGAVFGVGAEYALSNNWTAKVELNAFDFGNGTGDFQTLKAGVNYRFGGF